MPPAAAPVQNYPLTRHYQRMTRDLHTVLSAWSSPCVEPFLVAALLRTSAPKLNPTFRQALMTENSQHALVA
jgi:hypothetical protein